MVKKLKKLTKNNKKKIVPRKHRNTKKKYRGGVVLKREWFKNEAAFDEAKKLQNAVNDAITNNIDKDIITSRLDKFKEFMKNDKNINNVATSNGNDEYFQAQQKQIERAEKLYTDSGEGERQIIQNVLKDNNAIPDYFTRGNNLIKSKDKDIVAILSNYKTDSDEQKQIKDNIATLIQYSYLKNYNETNSEERNKKMDEYFNKHFKDIEKENWLKELVQENEKIAAEKAQQQHQQEKERQERQQQQEIEEQQQQQQEIEAQQQQQQQEKEGQEIEAQQQQQEKERQQQQLLNQQRTETGEEMNERFHNNHNPQPQPQMQPQPSGQPQHQSSSSGPSSTGGSRRKYKKSSFRRTQRHRTSSTRKHRKQSKNKRKSRQLRK
jgi:hypothetical protein